MLLYLSINIIFIHPALSAYLCFPHTIIIVTGSTSIEMNYAATVIFTQQTWFHFVQSDPFYTVQNRPVLIKSCVCALVMNPKGTCVCRVVCAG